MNGGFGTAVFRCDVVRDGESVAMRLFGELDVATAPEAEAAFSKLAQRRVPVVLDLRGLTFMDSRGIRMLLSFREQALTLGFPFIVACGERVERLLELTGIRRRLEVVQLPGR